MVMVPRENGRNRSILGAREPVDDVILGMNVGASLGGACACWLVAIRVVSGPGVFERLGLTMWDLGELYCIGGLALGAAVGFLQRVRHRALGAVLQFLLLPILPLVATLLNMGLSFGRPWAPLGVLVTAAIAVWVVSGCLGYWLWRYERRANPPSGVERTLRLERDVERRPSES